MADDAKDTASTLVPEDAPGIVGYITEKYNEAKNARYTHEQRWLKAYRNYRGLYGPDVQFTEAEKSRVFIKVTKTKTLAAYGQIVDVLFANQKFPLSVEPTELPEGVVGDVSFDPQEPEQVRDLQSPYGFAGDGNDLPPGATETSLMERLGPLQSKLEPVEDKLKEGAGKTPSVQLSFWSIRRVIGYNSLPQHRRGTRTGGKDSYKLPRAC